jgi:hypothetical protein
MADTILVNGVSKTSEGLKPDIEPSKRGAEGGTHVVDGVTKVRMGLVKLKRDSP